MDGCSRYSPYAYLQVNRQEHPPVDFPPPQFSIEEFNLYHYHYQSHFDYDKNAMHNSNSALLGHDGNFRVARTEPPAIAHSNSNSSTASSSSSSSALLKGPLHPTICSAASNTNSSNSKDDRDREREKDSAEHKLVHQNRPEDTEKKLTTKALSRARHTLQQRLKRQNETPEQKAVRRQRNAELNRRRRMNKEDIRVAMEKVKNRLRQRIKREVDRMLRTRQKRDDFLRETFEQMSTVFSDAHMIQYQGRIANVLQEISN